MEYGVRYPCSKFVGEKTIFCFSLPLFQRIVNAFLYDLYHQIAHILTFPCHNRYIYNNTDTNRVIKSMEVCLSTHRDPLSILKGRMMDAHVSALRPPPPPPPPLRRTPLVPRPPS